LSPTPLFTGEQCFDNGQPCSEGWKNSGSVPSEVTLQKKYIVTETQRRRNHRTTIDGLRTFCNTWGETMMRQVDLMGNDQRSHVMQRVKDFLKMTRLFICGSGLTKTIGAIKEFPTKAI
jgi:hypothetical protein